MLKLGSTQASTSFFFSQNLWHTATWDFLQVHIGFRVVFLVPKGLLIEELFNLSVYLHNVDILVKLILLVHQHGMFFHCVLFISSIFIHWVKFVSSIIFLFSYFVNETAFFLWGCNRSTATLWILCVYLVPYWLVVNCFHLS